MNKERLRKENPSRSEPIREWQRMLREAGVNRSADGDGSNGSSHSGGNGAHEKSWDDAVTDAVSVGYQVIEEQIAQGKRVAEEISKRSYTTNSIGGDVSELVQRLLRFYTDIGSTCFELIDSVSHSTVFQDSMRGFGDKESANAAQEPPAGGQQSSSQQTNAQANVPVDVVSESPARITLDINGPINGCKLGVHGLFALDSAKPPLRETRFHYTSTDAQPTLRVRIPPGQAPDTYTGVVIDTNNNQPRGTLTVQISDEESA